MAFPFLTAFMIFIVVLALLRMRATRREKERTDAFWEKESEANSARKVDLSTITYFTFDAESLPKPDDSDKTAQERFREVSETAGKRMLNLNGISNTDLKLEYGPQNLDELTIYGDNYSALESAILSYGTALHDVGRLDDAITVLERGIALPTDLTGNYNTLADYYEEAGKIRKLEDLALIAEKNLTGFAKTVVLKRLRPEPLENIELS